MNRKLLPLLMTAGVLVALFVAASCMYEGFGSARVIANLFSDNAVLVTGLDTVTAVRDGTPTSATGRVTFVVARRGADWQIVHFHRSAMPQ